MPVSATTTEPYVPSCRGKSDRRRPTTVRPLPVQHGMPSTTIYLAYCSFQRAAQRSYLYGDSRAPQSRMEQDIDNRRRQRFVRSSKGVRAKQFARGILKYTTLKCVQIKILTSTFTSLIATMTAFTRAIHQRVPQIVSMRISYCKLYRPNIRRHKPTWREETSDLSKSGV